jgi:hypothetical protein
MRRSNRWRLCLVGPLLASVSLAPAAPDPPLHLADPPPGRAGPPPDLTPLAQARYAAAVRQYDETWAYYQQARIDSYQVYVWSRLVLDSRRDLAVKPAEQITALEEHLDRMRKLESLIKKVRRLGFGRSYDVGASEYYRLEAELWLARAQPPK